MMPTSKFHDGTAIPKIIEDKDSIWYTRSDGSYWFGINKKCYKGLMDKL